MIMYIFVIFMFFFINCESFYYKTNLIKRKHILYNKKPIEEDYFDKFIKYSKEKNTKKQEEYLYKYMMYKFLESLKNEKKS